LTPLSTREVARSGAVTDVAVSSAENADLTAWLGNYQSLRTREAYRRDALLWDAWRARNGVHLLRPKPGDITKWVDEMRQGGRLSESTLARRVSSVLNFYRWARHEGITKADPTPFKRPKVHRDTAKIIGLSREQFLNVCRQAGGARNLAFVSLLGRCGLRVSEALLADIESLGEQRGHHTISVVGKGNRPRTVVIPPHAWVDLTAYLDERVTGPIFLTRTGRRWERRDAWHTVEAIGRRAGITGFHPHKLRHTAATLMLDAGEPLDRVQKTLGHASPETTMKYAEARDRLDGSPVYGLDRYLSEE